MGEGAGLIYSVDAAEKITRDVSREAEDQLDAINRLRTCVFFYFTFSRFHLCGFISACLETLISFLKNVSGLRPSPRLH